MSFNWNLPKATVVRLFNRIGTQVTLIKADGSKAKGMAVFDSSSKFDIATGSKLTGTDKQLYISPSINKVPVVGDYIQQGTEQFHIKEVEIYKPTTVVLAYRVVVQ